MRYNWGYVINKTQAIIEFDKKTFEEVANNREEKYEYIQTFDDNNIVEYNTIVVNLQSEHSVSRIDIVAELYSIVPNEIRHHGKEQDLIFRFLKPLQKAAVMNLWKVLEQLYFANVRYFTFFDPTKIEKVTDSFVVTTNIYRAGEWIDNSRKIAINDVKNIDAINEAMLIDMDKAISILKRSEKIDYGLWVIVWYGWIVDYIFRILKSIEATYKFLEEHFDIKFMDTTDAMELYMNEGIGISSEWIVISWDGMLILDEKGKTSPLTDFQITVHYKIKRKSWVSYIVSFIKRDLEVRHVEWVTSFSETRVCEFVSSYWPFHITSSKKNIQIIHTMISESIVPEITVIDKYGVNEYNGEKIIAFKDYIFCTESKLTVPRMAWNWFYFIDWVNGVKVEWKEWQDIDSMLTDKAPSLGYVTQKKYHEYHSVVKEVFKDTAWDLLIMTAATWIAHMMFSPEKSCPMFFTTGITGSGKTTYAKYLCSFFGITKPMSIEGTTPFPLRISLTLLNKLPLFLNEYRSKMWWVNEKISILKSLFDGTAFERGRKDLSLESHTFSAFVFMEGEELPESGATRSRSIIWTVKKSWQGTASAEDVLKDNRELFWSFIYSYMKNAKKDMYFESITEWQKIFKFPGIEQRILDNISLLYASVMAFAPEHKEEYIKTCKIILDKQMSDFQNNGTIAEIINIIGKYIGSRFAKIHTDWYNIVLSWNDIVDFIERTRIATELKPDSYREHCEAFWIESWFFIVKSEDTFTQEEVMVDWLRIPVDWIDKRFLCNPTVFKLWSSFNKVTKQ